MKEAKEKIEKLTHVKRNVSIIKVFLHKLGLKPRKTAALSAKVDPAAQEDFKKKYWSLN
ncbi:MAG: winged helix-turn-helix domain-containing protein [Parachlamydiaceae bacterium]|nr:winged helix-turn-helix domain-containing protein [Parachlamydiaceae bacterium]